MGNRAASKKAVPIQAVLIGSDRCEALGVTVRDAAPVLNLCRKLVAAGHDPQLPLHVYRGDVLALRVRSIGEGSRLSIAGDGVGFRDRIQPDGVSSVGAHDQSVTSDKTDISSSESQAGGHG